MPTVWGVGPARALAQDNSPAPILQWFESSYATMEHRTADLFLAGYGTVWVPPPGRADNGGFSVGYDVYDRFDLGTPGNPTLYGTQTGFRTFADTLHRAGGRLHIDAIINHNGFSDQGTVDTKGTSDPSDDVSFLEAGGYPGFVLQNPDGGNDPFGVPGTDGDFNSSYDYGDLRGRLAGLIDINHATNHRFIRHPVDVGDPRNIPAGAEPAFGRLANQVDPNNRRFYPDRDGPSISVFDPKAQQGDIRIYQFNTQNPMAGDAVEENATGLLMRYLQWMVQVNGVDGFRIDAAKHVEGFTFDFLDRAVYRQNPRLLLDGSTDHVFSYSEVFDGNKAFQQGFVRKDINPNDIGTVGGNRDVLDFPLHFALKQNLSGNGFQNDWRGIVGAGMDSNDDGKLNGSQGVKFVVSHDDGSPFLGNVAHAYTLLTPGNAVVYFNGKEFGDNRDFPKDGRGDALGGQFGDTITELVELRNTHGRGDYRERWLDKEYHAFERSGSMLVLLSNRNDAGVSDFKRLNVELPFGTHLIELTGNADHDPLAPKVITVTNDFFNGPSYVNARFLNNAGQDHGYLVYGLQNPQSDHGIELTNVSQVLEGDHTGTTNFENGTNRLADLHVITGDSFQVKLATKRVELLGDPNLRDHNADGDQALIRLNGGLDVNGNGSVDFVTPGTVSYGFENFTTLHNPGYFANNGAGGDGLYLQDIDASQLGEGQHFLTVRAFRHREDGGPAVYSDFKKVIYVDRLLPETEVAGSKPFSPFDGDLDFQFRSLDLTADTVHVFRNLTENVTEAEILARVANGEGATSRIDRDLFQRGWLGTESGNNVFTIVTREITGTTNIQRFTGVFVDGRGAGLGDLNFNNTIDTFDLVDQPDAFEAVLYSRGAAFNPAADIDGNGRVDNLDLYQLDDVLVTAGVSQSTTDAYDAMLLRRGNVNQQFGADAFDIDFLYEQIGTTPDNEFLAWFYDLNVDGTISEDDIDTLVMDIFRTTFGDIDLDGSVNLDDFNTLAINYNTSGGWARGDFNGDGFVDIDDFNTLAIHYGVGSGGTGGTGSAAIQSLIATSDLGIVYSDSLGRFVNATVPEPGSLVLLAAGGLLLTRRSCKPLAT